jgi:hypothetical protein
VYLATFKNKTLLCWSQILQSENKQCGGRMEQIQEYLQNKYGKYSIIMLHDDVPSTIQQELCGQLENWEFLRLDKPLTSNNIITTAAAATAAQKESLEEDEEDDPHHPSRPKKKHKSQRRMEKEQEYYERQTRMQENQKAKKEAMKRTKCKFFQLGKCKEGDNCRFGHD